MRLHLSRFARSTDASMGALPPARNERQRIGSALHRGSNGVVAKISVASYLLYGLALIPEGVALVFGLLRRRYPAAVRRLVVLANVVTLERVTRRARPHVSVERLEALTPCVAHRNAERAVAFVLWVCLVVAASLGSGPGLIRPGIGHLVRLVGVCAHQVASATLHFVDVGCVPNALAAAIAREQPFSTVETLDRSQRTEAHSRFPGNALDAPTTLGVPGTQFLGLDNDSRAASAHALPRGMRRPVSVGLPRALGYDKERVKPLAGKINGFHAPNSII